MPERPLDRYRSLISDWGAFETACTRPLPTVLRVNTLRADPEALARRLRNQGIALDRVPWSDILFAMDHPAGNTLEHWLGLYYVQEAVQTLPALVLHPRVDDIVLDLCAAPGGKTTQLGALMENTGILVANEPNGRRQPSLLANVNRLGLLNVMITGYRGESFPTQTRFDRILLDAPCSGEGTLRKEPALAQGASLLAIQRLASLQKRLLLRAYDLLAPGGVLVYSTCTFAPEENEAVVAHLLQERPAAVTRIDLPVSGRPGLTSWASESFPDELANARRFYPQDLDSGGGFIARIERRSPITGGR